MRTVETHTGTIYLSAKNGKLTRIAWTPEETAETGDEKTLDYAENQLKKYFNGEVKTFDIPMELSGTPFQKKVWEELQKIPYGTLVTYGDIAKKLGSAPRAVGGAVGANPIPIVVPCHRVVGAGGQMTGFSGGNGIPTKQKLLHLEGLTG